MQCDSKLRIRPTGYVFRREIPDGVKTSVWPSRIPWLRVRCAFSDHRGENEDAFFASFNEAAKRVPCPKSGNIGSIRFLACDDHYGAEAVAVKLRHCSEVCGEHFTVPGLQCSDERIHGLFGCRNHKEIVGRCGGVAPAAPISASFWNQKEYIGCIPPQAGGWAEIPTRFISPHCRSPRRYCQMPWSRHTIVSCR
jgi:hypothetical protein